MQIKIYLKQLNVSRIIQTNHAQAHDDYSENVCLINAMSNIRNQKLILIHCDSIDYLN